MKAIHLPGGDRLADIRIDLPASFRAQDEWLAGLQKRDIRSGAFANVMRLVWYAALRRLGLYPVYVEAGFRRDWFEDFADYWTNVLEGRPIELSDFHALRLHYRLRAQRPASLEWNSASTHLENWQEPRNFYLTLQYTFRLALNPIRDRIVERILRPGTRALEYGCSLAPMYSAWRQFFSHRHMEWVLADIPGFAFHYARHIYGRDAGTHFLTIDATRLDDPLHGVEGEFDLIIVLEVFEHLHQPRAIAEYLLRRLKPGGLLCFDYVLSQGKGLDSYAGLTERRATLQYLYDQLEPVHGSFERAEESLHLCVGRKKS